MKLPASRRPDRDDTLHDALDRLAVYAFLDGPGLACHGPMGAEALSALGFDAAVPAWVDRYLATHPAVPAPPTHTRIDLDHEPSWRHALGDFARVSDWAVAFGDALETAGPDDVIGTWVPRLVSGYGGGLTHGLIRTAHAVRMLPGQPGTPASPLVRRELAHALAAWAAWYRPLSGHPHLTGPLGFEDAVGAVPRPTSAWTPMEAATFTRIDELAGFADAVEAHAPARPPDQALSDLAEGFCRVLLTFPEVSLAFVHLVTPISAARTLIARVPGLDAATVYARAWQVGAGLVAGGPPLPPLGETALPGDVPTGPDELAARAADHGDAHVVKFTEACLREYALAPRATFLAASQRVLDATPPA